MIFLAVLPALEVLVNSTFKNFIVANDGKRAQNIDQIMKTPFTPNNRLGAFHLPQEL